MKIASSVWSDRSSTLVLRTPAVVLLATAALWLAAASSSRAALTHRYTFNDGTANDSVGGANGTLASGATASGGQAVLDGVSNYVNLPGPAINITGYTNATFEGWFTYSNTNNWPRLFDFGDTNAGTTFGRNYIFYTPKSGGNDNRAAISDTDPGFNSENQAHAGLPLTTGVEHHVAVVFDKSGANAMSVYVDGILGVGTPNPGALTKSLSSVSNVFAYLGKSTYNDPYMAGSINEFRIYDTALSAGQVAADFQAGPNGVVPEPASLALAAMVPLGLFMAARRKRSSARV